MVAFANTWFVANSPLIGEVDWIETKPSAYLAQDQSTFDMEAQFENYRSGSSTEISHAVVFCDSLPCDDHFQNHTQWLAEVESQTTQIFSVLQVALKKLAAVKGQKTVTLVTDIFGIGGVSSSKAASALSGGVIGMAKSLAKEMSRYDLAINVVAIGSLPQINIDSRLNAAQLKLVKMTSLGSEVNDAALPAALQFLQTSGMSVTGQVIRMDGGLLI